MPSLSVGIPHNLGQEEATRRLKDHFAGAKDRYGHHFSDLTEQWDGHVLTYAFTTFGVRVEGTVTSAVSEVTVEAQLPLVAAPLKGTIERQIREDLEKALS